MGMVSISDSYMALLQDYSDKTGVPVDRCVADALFDWSTNVAPVKLEQLGPSVITLKPAIRYQFKTGQRDWPKT
jgi:hypothetical protein